MSYSKKQFNLYANARRAKLVKSGLCSYNCGRKLVTKWYCRKCADKYNAYIRKYWYKNHKRNKRLKLAYTHKYRFGGLRDKVIERDKHSCKVCGYSKKIRVHHINEDRKDNRMENLITICIICHTVVERMNRTKPDMFHLFTWLKK